jgi:hypothetical protein
MHDTESRNAHARESLGRAVVVSLLLHVAVLFINLSSPGPATSSGDSPGPARPDLFATITRPANPLPPVPPSTHRKAMPMSSLGKQTELPKQPTEQRRLTASTGVWAEREHAWSSAERTDMDKFLNELTPRPAPPTAGDLSQRAMAMARQMMRDSQNDAEVEMSDSSSANGKVVEPFSLEMYFDAFVRKLNRSAAFVKNDPRTPGSRKALVQISLNADGSLKSYRVLRSADQEAEIAYIKNVIDRASPFSAFPPDIRNGRDSLSIMMCIYPAHEGESGGFSRSFGARDCRD